MVKEIDTKAMERVVTKDAQELRRATQAGMATAMEDRMAKAIWENAQNLKKQAANFENIHKEMRVISGQMTKALEQSTEASKQAAKAIEDAAKTNKAVMDSIEFATMQAVRKAMPTELDSIVSEAQKQIADTVADASSEMSSTVSKASKVIERAEYAADEMRDRAHGAATFSYMPLIVRVVLVLIMVAFVASCATVGWRMLPLATGKVDIAYTTDFRSDLDATQLELTKTRNELNAYMEAFPEGLSEQREHDLNAANQSAQDAYDNKS